MMVEKDAWEPWSNLLYDRSTGRELQVRIWIQYCDSNKLVTQREVTTERYFFDAKTREGAVAGFCHLREARRVFNLQNVLRAACKKTQQTIHEVGPWLDTQYRHTPAFSRDQFLNVYGAALGALHAIAKADGTMRSAEKSVIERFAARNGLEDPAARALVLAEMTTWQAPSARRFGDDLRDLEGAALDLREEVFLAAQEMIASDKTQREAEFLALERMRKALKLPRPEAKG